MKQIQLKTKKKIEIVTINKRRAYIIFGFLIICGLVIICRFFMLQIIDSSTYKTKADKQHIKKETLKAKRGEIFMVEKDYNNRYKVATNGQDMAFIISINPKQIKKLDSLKKKETKKDKEQMVSVLNKTFFLDETAVRSKINQQVDYIVLTTQKQEEWLNNIFKDDLRSFQILSEIEDFTEEKRAIEKKNVEKILINRTWEFFATQAMRNELKTSKNIDELSGKIKLLDKSGIEVNSLKLESFVKNQAKITDLIIISDSLQTVLVNKLFYEFSTLEEKKSFQQKPYSKEELINAKLAYLNNRGVRIEAETERIYPENNLAAQVIGFLGYTKEGSSRTGQYGIEQYYNKDLEGIDGYIKGESNPSEIWLPFGKVEMVKPKHGKDIVLTIDRTVQYEMEKKLYDTTKRLESPQASIIIMNLENCDQSDHAGYDTCGGIVAMANYPVFDLNNYSQVQDVSIYKNLAIYDAYEPGSIFKPITMAGALDSGKVTPKTTYNDTGSYKAKDWEKPIYNYKGVKYGRSSMTKVLEFSINTGSIFAMHQTGKEAFRNYVKKFGIDQKTDIDLTGEQSGNINSLKYLNGDVNFATASFGQGITSTPIGVLNAISVIANGGKSIKPHVLLTFVDSNGKEQKYWSESYTQVIKSESAKQLTDMLVSTVDNGIAKKAHIDGYKIAGKSGTAQVADLKKGGYSATDTIQSFVGFFPAYEPRFSILVKIDRPNVGLSTDSAVPLFKEVVEYLIKYYNIPKE